MLQTFEFQDLARFLNLSTKKMDGNTVNKQETSFRIAKIPPMMRICKTANGDAVEIPDTSPRSQQLSLLGWLSKVTEQSAL